MSLIYFHMVLISTAILFSIGLGIWELGSFSNVHRILDLGVGIGSFVFALGLACYLIWFIKKKKPTMIQ